MSVLGFGCSGVTNANATNAVHWGAGLQGAQALEGRKCFFFIEAKFVGNETFDHRVVFVILTVQ